MHLIWQLASISFLFLLAINIYKDLITLGHCIKYKSNIFLGERNKNLLASHLGPNLNIDLFVDFSDLARASENLILIGTGIYHYFHMGIQQNVYVTEQVTKMLAKLNKWIYLTSNINMNYNQNWSFFIGLVCQFTHSPLDFFKLRLFNLIAYQTFWIIPKVDNNLEIAKTENWKRETFLRHQVLNQGLETESQCATNEQQWPQL